MTKQILLGGIVGGIVVFLAGFAWHMVPSLGEAGVKMLPNEDLAVTALRTTNNEPGFYMFPGMDTSAPKEKQQAATEKYMEKYRQGPTGILIYRQGGTEFSFAKLLVNQFLFGLVAAFFVSWLLALAAGSLPSYGQRVLFVAVVALVGALYIDLPYVNWYGFPVNYTISHAGGVVVSWAVAGLALAAIIKRPAGAAA
jgi:hypothetical protein